jgi:hypothetical protein
MHQIALSNEQAATLAHTHGEMTALFRDQFRINQLLHTTEALTNAVENWSAMSERDRMALLKELEAIIECTNGEAAYPGKRVHATLRNEWTNAKAQWKKCRQAAASLK